MAIRLLKYFFFLLAFFAYTEVFAQPDVKVKLMGSIQNEDEHTRMAAVKIKIFQNGSIVANTVTDNLGKYSIDLEIGQTYDIQFTQNGFLSKNIRIDTHNIPEEKRINTFELKFDGGLFKGPELFNPDVLKEPVAIAKWDGKEKISVDESHAAKRKEEIKDEYERAVAAGKDPAAAKAEFDQLVLEGDAAMTAKDFKLAVDKYGAALKVIPKKEPAVAKLADAKAKYDEWLAKNASEEKYAALIKDGDALIASGKYAEAKPKFVEANKMKPKETYPKEQLAFLEGKLAGDKLKADYDRIIADADKKFTSKFYQQAIDQYREASKLMPKEQYPIERIAEAEGLLKTAMEKSKIDMDYQRKKDDADAKFRAAKYEEAITLYEEALNIKPSEQYPKDQIAASNKAIEDRLYAEKKKQYDAIIAQADLKFNTKDFEGSITKYEEASAVLPKETYPSTQIGLARKGIEDREAAAKRKQYDDLVAKADKLFTATDYDNAITTYQSALDLFSSEEYPKEQIKKSQTALFKKNEKELRAKYDGIIKQADGKFNTTDFEGSITLYEEASAIIPEEAYPGKQITKARDEISKRAEKEKRKQYDALIAIGDTKFNAGQFEECIASYQSASEILPTEKYPKDQMDAAYKKMGAAAEALKKKEQYDGLIADADAKFGSKDYQASIDVYEMAADLLPKEEYPKKQISNAKDLLAQYKKQKEQYDALIAKADDKFTGGDYKKCIELYTSASAVLPDEQYPRERIIEATGKIDAEAAEKMKREEFDRLVKQGDNDMRTKQYQTAVDSYKAALDLYGEEQYPKDQIERALGLLAVVPSEPIAKLEPKVIDRTPEAKKTGHTSKDVERLRNKWLKINSFRIENKSRLDERQMDAMGRSMDHAEKTREIRTSTKEKVEPEKPLILDERTYMLGNKTITEVTVKKGEGSKVFRKSADKNHTYYAEIIVATGEKWRDMTPLEWTRETGLEADVH